MELEHYVEDIRRQVALAAEAAGDDARPVAERLISPLDAAMRLAVQQALADAADEITVELAPGSVELRIRGRELTFVVSPPPVEPPGAARTAEEPEPAAVDAPAADDGEMTRINVRMPEHLKARVEQAASAQRLSVNAWLVRAASAALERPDPAPSPERGTGRGAQRYRGWAR